MGHFLLGLSRNESLYNYPDYLISLTILKIFKVFLRLQCSSRDDPYSLVQVKK
jgi:hypothetical protein